MDSSYLDSHDMMTLTTSIILTTPVLLEDYGNSDQWRKKILVKIDDDSLDEVSSTSDVLSWGRISSSTWGGAARPRSHSPLLVTASTHYQMLWFRVVDTHLSNTPVKCRLRSTQSSRRSITVVNHFESNTDPLLLPDFWPLNLSVCRSAHVTSSTSNTQLFML